MITVAVLPEGAVSECSWYWLDGGGGDINRDFRDISSYSPMAEYGAPLSIIGPRIGLEAVSVESIVVGETLAMLNVTGRGGPSGWRLALLRERLLA